MWSSLRIASLGALTQQKVLDLVSNNIAHSNTISFKVQRADTVDVPPGTGTFGDSSEPGPMTLSPSDFGGSALVVGPFTTFSRGEAMSTGNPLDFSINGEGFIPVQNASGQVVYTRIGALRLDVNRTLTTAEGGIIVPPIVIPPNAREILIDQSGNVTAKREELEPELVGQIQLIRFNNPEGLERLGPSLYAATAASGPGVAGTPGRDGLGELVPGTIEWSNVDIRAEMMRMLQAQRAYQVNLRAMRTVDEMLQVANSLQRQ